MAADCVFCDIVAGIEVSRSLRWWAGGVMSFEPLNPVTPGHLLVVPFAHVTDALHSPFTTGLVMATAASIAERPCNLITSCGPEATQTVMHLHVHLIPRRPGDGLLLPWSEQEEQDRG